MHTAVKIAPQYSTNEHPVIHVLDASRAVVVVSNLLQGREGTPQEQKEGEAEREDYVSEIAEQYSDMREEYYASLEVQAQHTRVPVCRTPTPQSHSYIHTFAQDRRFLSLEDARSKAFKIDWASKPPAPAPNTLGVTPITDVKVADLIPFIDWSPFFAVWELRGKYPNRGNRQRRHLLGSPSPFSLAHNTTRNLQATQSCSTTRGAAPRHARSLTRPRPC